MPSGCEGASLLQALQYKGKLTNWSFGAAVNNNHAVTLDGYNKGSNQVHVSDPISGSYWISTATFENIYNARKYAVVVR